MPFKSAKQKAYLHKNKPEMAARWDAEEKQGKPKGKAKKNKSHKAFEGLKNFK